MTAAHTKALEAIFKEAMGRQKDAPLNAIESLLAEGYADTALAALREPVAEVPAAGPLTDAALNYAARYQWLRHRVSGHRNDTGAQSFAFPTALGLPPVGNLMQGSVGQHLDAAIDAAIAAHSIHQPSETK